MTHAQIAQPLYLIGLDTGEAAFSNHEGTEVPQASTMDLTVPADVWRKLGKPVRMVMTLEAADEPRGVTKLPDQFQPAKDPRLVHHVAMGASETSCGERWGQDGAVGAGLRISLHANTTTCPECLRRLGRPVRSEE